MLLPLLRTPRRLARGAPRWPFTFNPDSLQAQGLLIWAAGPHASIMTPVNYTPRSATASWAAASAAPDVVAGEQGMPAWKFNGSTQAIRWTSVPAGFRFENLVCCLWALADNPIDLSGFEYPTSLSNGTSSTTAYCGNLVWDHTSTSATRAWLFYNGAHRTNRYTASLLPGQWYHFGQANVSATDWRRYLNGTMEGSLNPTVLPLTTNQTSLSLGGVDRGGSPLVAPFPGQIMDYRLYDPTVVLGYVDQLMAEIYDPATRWDLYYELGRKSYFFVSTAAALTETLVPTGDTGTPTNATGTFANVDEGVDTASDGLFISPTDKTAQMVKRLSYSPGLTSGRQMLGAGAGAVHKVRYKPKYRAGAGMTTVTVTIKEAGVLRATPINAMVVSSDAVIEGTFDSTGISDLTAADLETEITMVPGSP